MSIQCKDNIGVGPDPSSLERVWYWG